jgi:hypothetical protein
MLSIPDTLDIKLDTTPLQYQRTYEYGADTFFFRCNHGHLGKYNLPVSTFKGFEGTVKERLRCTRRGCDFYQWIFLEEWVYQDDEVEEIIEEYFYFLVDNQHNEITDNQGNQVLEAPIPLD